MGEIKGFLKYTRQDFEKEPASQRKKHWKEFLQYLHFSEDILKQQGARCMDCGVPFCHWGCPLSNIIPDWNDLVYHGRWEDALERLHKTNNFPEFTGRLCPAPCENACVLAINEPAVTIKNIEFSIIEKAHAEGWIKPRPPQKRTGKRIAVIGSGPAGLASADQLNKKGHKVTVYEKNECVGGLLALGIPDFKMEKYVIKRRVKQMEEEGIVFKTGVHIGVDLTLEDVRKKFDAVVLCGGAELPRDLPVEGRELKGVHFAMEYLSQQNRRNKGVQISDQETIYAKDKEVVVLGGGDTGSDCVGTANRQGAKSVKQYELLPQPPKERSLDNPWPRWALIQRTSSSHEEGCERDYCIMTKRFSGENGVLKKLHAVRLKFGEKDPQTGRRPMEEIPGSEFTINVDLVFLSMGFLGPVKAGMLEQLDVDLDARGNVKTNESMMTNIDGIFAAGDMRRGQSLVVWAIYEGRQVAEYVHSYVAHKK